MSVVGADRTSGRLKRVDCSRPGIARRGRGRGFEYLDERGSRITDPTVLARIRDLAIPPAWSDVWICCEPNGHIQATGIDAAGRKQYRYHDRWRERRDRQKFESMVEFGRALPRLRRRVRKDLAHDELTRDRVLACAVRLLDRGFFRIGSEEYAEENATYGLATMRRDHVSLSDGTATFDYAAKGGQRRIQSVSDPEVSKVIRAMKRRRGGGPELLAYRQGRRWVDVKSADINEYVRDAAGGAFTAKDFRTWNATVLAAVALAGEANAGIPQRKRRAAMRRAVEQVAEYLGNTPAVCRSSYIDPRVFDRFDGGITIQGSLPELAGSGAWPRLHRRVELAVLELLD